MKINIHKKENYNMKGQHIKMIQGINNTKTVIKRRGKFTITKKRN